MNPFKLKPVFKDYLWGGEKLRSLYPNAPQTGPVAECWTLSAHPSGDCVIADGAYSGKHFSEFVRDYPEKMGYNYLTEEGFPVLIKLIDAKEGLSVQVHPDDAYAARVEHGRGKTEMWYVVDCEPGAYLYFGFEQPILPEEFRRRIREETLTEVLHKAYVHPGDVFFVEAGTIHAIGAGILVAEIQQNSDTTYRVYDYGRRGADGKLRELHVEKALEVTKLAPADKRASLPASSQSVGRGGMTTLADCPYFVTKRLLTNQKTALNLDGKSFLSVLCIGGKGMLFTPDGWSGTLEKGESVFVPSDCGVLTLSENLEVLLAYRDDSYSV